MTRSDLMNWSIAMVMGVTAMALSVTGVIAVIEKQQGNTCTHNQH